MKKGGELNRKKSRARLERDKHTMKNTKPFVSFCGSGKSGGMKKEKESEVDCIEDRMENE